MFEDRDDAYDRLLDELDRGRLNRLTFIRKTLALGIAAPAISSTLAQLPFMQGVEADAQKVAPATINYWSVVTQKTAFDQGEGSVIKLFEKAYPHIKVVVQEIPFADYATKLSTAAR